MNKKKRLKRKFKIFTNVFLAVGVIFFIAILYNLYSAKKIKKEEFEASIKIIDSLKNKDINKIENEINDFDNKKKLNKRLDDIINDLGKDKNNKEFFKDYIFMGDSITEAMKSYGIIPEYRILAYKGENVIAAQKREVPKLYNIKAKKIIVFYGMNDLQNFDKVEDFIEKYRVLIREVKEKSKGAEVIVEKILPIEYFASNKDIRLKEDRVILFNENIEKLCKEEGVKSIDGSFILKNKGDLYEPDGIHPKMEFYNYWLAYIKETIN